VEEVAIAKATTIMVAEAQAALVHHHHQSSSGSYHYLTTAMTNLNKLQIGQSCLSNTPWTMRDVKNNPIYRKSSK
jgi:hypothetical protein